ncbi:MAG: TraM recognition domain-containing protein, partial [Planctomycetales bacterium]|nr:TraM recognition domain-containing protein [Planctomycetales bacterium]
NLPAVIDMLMGIDPATGLASPKYFESVLKSMMGNSSLDGFIQACASNIYQLGQRAFGNIYSEFENNCRWATDGWMRRHLSGPSDFSFSWLGDDEHPITVFIVAMRGTRAFQASIPWLRTVSELSLEIFSTRTNVGCKPLLWVGDEYKSWGAEVEGVRVGFTILRDKNVKLVLYTQSWEQLVEMFGEHGAAELESCSTMQYFGCNDLATAERISRRLGKTSTSQSKGWFNREKIRREVDLVTPAEVMQELRSSSNIQYLMPSNSLPMRLERVAFKELYTRDGGYFAGLPLEGHYDDGLSK